MKEYEQFSFVQNCTKCFIKLDRNDFKKNINFKTKDKLYYVITKKKLLKLHVFFTMFMRVS